MRPTDRLAELSAEYDLPEGAARQLMTLLERVSSAPIALTAVRDVTVGVEVHVADSLAGLQVAELREASHIADLGSGGGFPGLVLAIALPGARVALVESVVKKAAFLRDVAAELGLADRVDVIPERAETWPQGLGAADVVTARALASLPVLLEYAAPLLRDGGVLVAWKGTRSAAEEADALAAAEALAMSPPAALAVPAGTVRNANERHLYVSSKVGPTPPRYPRRAGMARKRPHRASS
jgi:16S rRNA (guanine527-N7)-methyltransferase